MELNSDVLIKSEVESEQEETVEKDIEFNEETLNEIKPSFTCLLCASRFYFPANYFKHKQELPTPILSYCIHCKNNNQFISICESRCHRNNCTGKKELSPGKSPDDKSSKMTPEEDSSLKIMNVWSVVPKTEGIVCNHESKTLSVINKMLFCKICRTQKCPECVLPLAGTIQNHFLDNCSEDPQSHSCSLCNLLFLSNCALKAHKRLHLKESPYVCPDCGNIFKELRNLVIHLMTKCFHFFKTLYYTCAFCRGCFFLNKQAYVKHVLDVHVKIIYRCPVCQLIFPTAQFRDSHSSIVHSLITDGSVEEQCELCSGITSSPNHMDLHVANLAYKFALVCVCDKIFSSTPEFKKHFSECTELTDVPKNWAHLTDNVIRRTIQLCAVKTCKSCSIKLHHHTNKSGYCVTCFSREVKEHCANISTNHQSLKESESISVDKNALFITEDTDQKNPKYSVSPPLEKNVIVTADHSDYFQHKEVSTETNETKPVKQKGLQLSILKPDEINNKVSSDLNQNKKLIPEITENNSITVKSISCLQKVKLVKLKPQKPVMIVADHTGKRTLVTNQKFQKIQPDNEPRPPAKYAPYVAQSNVSSIVSVAKPTKPPGAFQISPNSIGKKNPTMPSNWKSIVENNKTTLLINSPTEKITSTGSTESKKFLLLNGTSPSKNILMTKLKPKKQVFNCSFCSTYIVGDIIFSQVRDHFQNFHSLTFVTNSKGRNLRVNEDDECTGSSQACLKIELSKKSHHKSTQCDNNYNPHHRPNNSSVDCSTQTEVPRQGNIRILESRLQKQIKVYHKSDRLNKSLENETLISSKSLEIHNPGETLRNVHNSEKNKMESSEISDKTVLESNHKNNPLKVSTTVEKKEQQLLDKESNKKEEHTKSTTLDTEDILLIDRIKSEVQKLVNENDKLNENENSCSSTVADDNAEDDIPLEKCRQKWTKRREESVIEERTKRPEREVWDEFYENLRLAERLKYKRKRASMQEEYSKLMTPGDNKRRVKKPKRYLESAELVDEDEDKDLNLNNEECQEDASKKKLDSEKNINLAVTHLKDKDVVNVNSQLARESRNKLANKHVILRAKNRFYARFSYSLLKKCFETGQQRGRPPKYRLSSGKDFSKPQTRGRPRKYKIELPVTIPKQETPCSDIQEESQRKIQIKGETEDPEVEEKPDQVLKFFEKNFTTENISPTKRKRKLSTRLIAYRSSVEEDAFSSGQVVPSKNEPEDTMWKCALCQVKLQDIETFREHILTHRIDDNAYQCMECGQCFAVRPSLEKHLIVFHKIDNIPKYIVENKCCNKLPDNKEDEPLKDNQCKVCREEFENSRDLNKHFRVHGMAFLRTRRSK